MKKITFIVIVLGLILSACSKDEEDATTDPIDNDNANYNFAVTDSQEAFTLITTATWCQYCWDWGIPTFEAAFAGENGIDSTKINGFTLHYSNSDPLYLQMASVIKNQFSIGGPPNLWIEFSNAYNLQPGGWRNAIKARQTLTSSCGVGLNKVLSDSLYKVYVKVNFFSSVEGIYNLAVYAFENGIVEPQITPTGIDMSFVHNRVLRGEITSNSPWGVQIFSGTSASEYKFEYTYTPAANVNIDQVSFVAVIYKMNSNGKPEESPNSNTK